MRTVVRSSLPPFTYFFRRSSIFLLVISPRFVMMDAVLFQRRAGRAGGRAVVDVSSLLISTKCGASSMGASLSLDKVDPVQAWQPWTPTKGDPWNLKWAGHLYRRAAFGAPIKDIRFAVDQGLDATV